MNFFLFFYLTNKNFISYFIILYYHIGLKNIFKGYILPRGIELEQYSIAYSVSNIGTKF